MAKRSEGRGSTAAIRADIELTRARMSHTLDEIGERLNPQNVKAQVKHSIREATIGKVEHMAQRTADRANEVRHDMTQTIRDNPIPAAMVGIGLGWLLWNGRRERTSVDTRFEYRTRYPNPSGRLAGRGWSDETTTRYGSAEATRDYGSEELGAVDRVRERVDEIGDTVKDRTRGLTDRAQETVEGVAARAQDVAGTVAEEARYRARRVEDQFYENPLVIGVAVLAAGLATGLALPATRKEAELMGGARDQLVDRAREAARETKEKVQHVAERVVDETRATVKEAAREEGLTR